MAWRKGIPALHTIHFTPVPSLPFTFCTLRALHSTQHLPQHILHSAPHALFKRRSSALHWQPYTLQTLHPTLQSLYTSYTLLNARRNPDAGPPNSTLRATNSRPYYAPCSTLPTLPRTLYTLTPSHPGLQTPHFTRYTAKLFIPQASPASNSTLAPDAPDLPDRGMGGVILTGLSRPKPQQGQVA